MRYYFLRIGDDDLDSAKRHSSKRAAIAAFRWVSDDLDRFGQDIEATIHIAEARYAIAEYPDFALSRGPRGGIRCERC